MGPIVGTSTYITIVNWTILSYLLTILFFLYVILDAPLLKQFNHLFLKLYTGVTRWVFQVIFQPNLYS